MDSFLYGSCSIPRLYFRLLNEGGNYSQSRRVLDAVGGQDLQSVALGIVDQLLDDGISCSFRKLEAATLHYSETGSKAML